MGCMHSCTLQAAFNPLGMDKALADVYMACERCRKATATTDQQNSFVIVRKDMEWLVRGKAVDVRYNGLLPDSGQFVWLLYKVSNH